MTEIATWECCQCEYRTQVPLGTTPGRCVICGEIKFARVVKDSKGGEWKLTDVGRLRG